MIGAVAIIQAEEEDVAMAGVVVEEVLFTLTTRAEEVAVAQGAAVVEELQATPTTRVEGAVAVAATAEVAEDPTLTLKLQLPAVQDLGNDSSILELLVDIFLFLA